VKGVTIRTFVPILTVVILFLPTFKVIEGGGVGNEV